MKIAFQIADFKSIEGNRQSFEKSKKINCLKRLTIENEKALL
jgi:hypothetical protein